jgi:hypothetical protein
MADTSNRRIGNLTAIFMIVIAVILDIIEFVLAIFGIGLILNRALTFIEYSVFIFWFWMLGVSFTKFDNKHATRRFYWSLGSMILEFIPIIGALPAFTAGVVRTIFTVRAEDRENESKSKVLKFSGRTPSRERLRIQENQNRKLAA